MTGPSSLRAGPLDGGFTMLSGLMEAGRIMPGRLRARDNSIPLTILSGFLGAGKTTLVNRLLANPEGRRIVVIVNDFGSIDIDAQLIRARTASTISLANGCACCTVAGDLTRTLVDIAQSSEPADAVLLEASGLADPSGIAQVALANPAMRLDGVVTLVDAETFARLSDDADVGALLASQIATADLVILNKIDLAGEVAEHARAGLRRLASGKPMIETSHADVPAAVVLGVAAEGGDARAGQQAVADAHGHFRSWNLSWSRALAGKRVRSVLVDAPVGVLRAKGILNFDDEMAPHVYQRVGRRFSLVAAEPGVGEDGCSRLVIIAAHGQQEPVGEWVDRLQD